MSRTISAQIVQARHPVEFAEVVKKMHAGRGKVPYSPDPNDWKWSYQSSHQGEAVSFTQLFANIANISPTLPVQTPPNKGRAMLAHKVNTMTIQLTAQTGRRYATEFFDNQKLLAGPDDNLPWEELNVHPKPTGKSVWIWNQPGSNEKPAWREHVLDAAILTPKGTVVQVHSEDGSTNLALMDLTTRTGKMIESFEGVFSDKEALTIMRGFATKTIFAPYSMLEPSKVLEMFGKNNEICLNARSVSISELLRDLRGPGFVQFGQTPPDDLPPPASAGPWINWEGVETPLMPTTPNQAKPATVKF